jgi:hypothetical protein
MNKTQSASASSTNVIEIKAEDLSLIPASRPSHFCLATFFLPLFAGTKGREIISSCTRCVVAFNGCGLDKMTSR